MQTRLAYFQQALRQSPVVARISALPLREQPLHPGATPCEALRECVAFDFVGPHALGAAIGGGGEGGLLAARLAGMTLHGAPYKGRNEDSIGAALLYPVDPCRPPITLLAVADGVGRSPAPHVASRTAIQSLLTAVGFHYEGRGIDDVVRSARRAFVVSRAVFAQCLAPMSATTLLIAISQGTRGIFLHLGDSQGAAIPCSATTGLGTEPAIVTRPHHHWIVQDAAVRRGKPLREAEWLRGPLQRHRLDFLLERSLGAIEMTQGAHVVEETRFALPHTGGWLLCGSDGLTGNIGIGNTLDLFEQYPMQMDIVVGRLLGRVIRRMPATVHGAGRSLLLMTSQRQAVRERAVTGDHISAFAQYVPDATQTDEARAQARHRVATLLAERMHVGVCAARALLRPDAAPERYLDAADWLNIQRGWDATAIANGLRCFGVVGEG
ncbi:MAG: protein phosphatase 2C domain-containing protein [Deltaproteobacteria bacterium]|nr:protein phosphatase 2C domain-containing protein [Deltaproteobacteria bacterium]